MAWELTEEIIHLTLGCLHGGKVCNLFCRSKGQLVEARDGIQKIRHALPVPRLLKISKFQNVKY
jgi:hypothetical protein